MVRYRVYWLGATKDKLLCPVKEPAGRATIGPEGIPLIPSADQDQTNGGPAKANNWVESPQIKIEPESLKLASAYNFSCECQARECDYMSA
jgi:hypothetical protein